MEVVDRGNSDLTNNVDFSFADFQQLGNGILPQLDAIRNHDGIYWSEANQCWVVTGHEEITEAFSGDLPLSCERLVQVTVGKIPVAVCADAAGSGGKENHRRNPE